MTSATVWFVDTAGSDTLNGLYPTFVSGYDGPKKTVKAALDLASSGDTIQCSSGMFTEHVDIKKDIYLFVKNTYFQALSMNSPSVYLLLEGDSLHVVDSFQMNNGYILTRNQSVKLKLIPNCVSLGGSVASFVDGLYYIGHESLMTQVTFLSGVNNDYRPVTVGFNKNGHDTVYFSAIVHAAAPPVVATRPTSLRNISTLRYWEIGCNAYNVLDGFLIYPRYDTITLDDEVFSGSALRLAWHDGIGSWKNLGGSGTGNRRGALSGVIPTDSLGIFTLANDSAGINALGSRQIVARFNPPSVCVNTLTLFYDNSFTHKANAVSWFWDFGDGSSTADTSSIKNPAYIYSSPGLYKVKLKVSNNLGFQDSTVRIVDIRPLPDVKFGYTKECFGIANKFTDSSNAYSPDAIMSRLWRFGDGGTATTKNANRVYSTSGDYTVTLIVTSSAGCKDSATHTASVYAIPQPDFVSPSVCISDSAVYHRVANTNPLDSDIKWSWLIDNSHALADTLVKFKFSTSDTFDIQLKGISKFGCADSVTKTSVIYGLPTLSFVLNSAVAGNNDTQCLNGNKFTFTPTIAAATGQSISSAAWNWGNGNSSNLPDSAVSYSAEATYTVKLNAVSDKGCRDSASSEVTVKGFLQPDFSKSGECVPGNIQFFESGTLSSTTIASRSWYMNDTLRGTGTPLNLSITTAGPHKITYIVSNADACIDSISRAFTFTPYPTLGFTTSPGIPFCQGDSVSITVSGGKNIEWLMDGDTNRTKVFKSALRYRVRAYNSANCFVSDDDTIIVYPKVAVDALRDTTIFRGGMATLRASGANTYSWSPATGLNTTTGAVVKSRPMNTVMYIVKGTDANTCAGSDTVTVTVVEPPFVRIPNIITPNGDNNNDAWDLSELENYDKYELVITDYKGDVVLNITSGYKNDWKAVKDGKELPEGMYYYRLFYNLKDKEYKGFIQVIR
jgi:gliding motility-associated-like protein